MFPREGVFESEFLNQHRVLFCDCLHLGRLLSDTSRPVAATLRVHVLCARRACSSTDCMASVTADSGVENCSPAFTSQTHKSRCRLRQQVHLQNLEKSLADKLCIKLRVYPCCGTFIVLRVSTKVMNVLSCRCNRGQDISCQIRRKREGLCLTSQRVTTSTRPLHSHAFVTTFAMEPVVTGTPSISVLYPPHRGEDWIPRGVISVPSSGVQRRRQDDNCNLASEKTVP